jgi:hypothetical protein
LKRLPILLDWQVEAALENAMTVPQANQIGQGLTRTLDSATALLVRLEQILGTSLDGTALDPRLREIQKTVSEGKDLAVATHDAAMAVNDVLETARKLKEPSAPLKQQEQEARPFDINEYTATAVQIATAAREASELIHDTSRLAESQASSRVQEMVDTSARNIAREGRDVTDHAALRAAQLMILLFVLLSLYTGLFRGLRKRTKRAERTSQRQ